MPSVMRPPAGLRVQPNLIHYDDRLQLQSLSKTDHWFGTSSTVGSPYQPKS